LQRELAAPVQAQDLQVETAMYKAPERSQTNRTALEAIALLGAAALIAWPAAKGIARRWRIRRPKARGEAAIDKALKDTFPASDPPAPRYFDIPVNRR
jgi:hypothetical protein